MSDPPEGHRSVTMRIAVADVRGQLPAPRSSKKPATLRTATGDRRAMVRDPYGNLYQIAHRNS